MALGASWSGDRFLASGLCPNDPCPTDSQDRMVLDVATDESLFCFNELDLFDRLGRRSTGECDLDAEPRTCLGDARGGCLVQGAHDEPRLVDVGMVYRRGVVYSWYGVDACVGESYGPMVVTLVGTCKWCFLCRSDSFASGLAAI